MTNKQIVLLRKFYPERWSFAKLAKESTKKGRKITDSRVEQILKAHGDKYELPGWAKEIKQEREELEKEMERLSKKLAEIK